MPAPTHVNAPTGVLPSRQGTEDHHDRNKVQAERPRGKLQDLLLYNPDFEDFLSRLVALTAESLRAAGADCSVSITVERRRRRTTVAASSTEAVQLDELQYGFHDGPCRTAARTGETVLVDDAAEDDRWPPYLATVRGSGHASILAVPIPLEGEARAALNCYAVRARAFDREVVAAAESHEALAAGAVILAVRFDGQARRSGTCRQRSSPAP